jgi:hypothetical protein
MIQLEIRYNGHTKPKAEWEKIEADSNEQLKTIQKIFPEADIYGTWEDGFLKIRSNHPGVIEYVTGLTRPESGQPL